MSQDNGKQYVFKEKSWEPVVLAEEDTLIYSMPVACGFIHKFFRFQISLEELHILKVDEERRYFLYAILHHRYQSRPSSNTLQSDHHFKQILFGRKNEVENMLSLQDVESNGAVSNLVRVYMGRDQKSMMAGRWFQNIDKE